MYQHIGLLLLLMFFNLAVLLGQNRSYTTQKVIIPPVIDGIFNEAVWKRVQWEDNFTQREPYDGEPPTQQTRFKILYDDNNLYVAIQALDSVPEKIEKRLNRRDEWEGDWVGIHIDSYDDDLTGYAFFVTAAGVKCDAHISNEDYFDETWDPVWYTKTTIDDDGWNAEIKIPFTQLRFAAQEEHNWGVQAVRWIFRKEEFSSWQHVPMESSRWVSMFGELKGIKGIHPKKEVELIPYIMGNTERYQQENGNPFATGTEYGTAAGLDGKIAVTNDLTLNFTINPDFGQVEADPSEVNLTTFETFFPERRPFFIEGSNIYNYRITDGDGPLSQDNLFYSRRIGRRPQYEPDLNDNEYMDAPEYSRILGAFKLSGKTRKGWSVGIMESITNREYATIDAEGEKRKELIEPLTNYFNTRLQKRYQSGKYDGRWYVYSH